MHYLLWMEVRTLFPLAFPKHYLLWLDFLWQLSSWQDLCIFRHFAWTILQFCKLKIIKTSLPFLVKKKDLFKQLLLPLYEPGNVHLTPLVCDMDTHFASRRFWSDSYTIRLTANILDLMIQPSGASHQFYPSVAHFARHANTPCRHQLPPTERCKYLQHAHQLNLFPKQTILGISWKRKMGKLPESHETM